MNETQTAKSLPRKAPRKSRKCIFCGEYNSFWHYCGICPACTRARRNRRFLIMLCNEGGFWHYQRYVGLPMSPLEAVRDFRYAVDAGIIRPEDEATVTIVELEAVKGKVNVEAAAE